MPLGLGALFLGGLAGLLTAPGWQAAAAHLTDLHLDQLALLLGLSVVNYLLRGLRWHLFVRRLRLRNSLTLDMVQFLGGFAMTVTPGRVGELVRMRWLHRATGAPAARTLVLALVDRAADLAALALVLLLSFAFGAVGGNGALLTAAGALGVAALATRPGVLGAVVTTLWRMTGRAPRLFARARRVARSLRHFAAPRLALAALVLGALGWLAEGWAFFLLLDWFDAGIGAPAAVSIFLFATLAGGLTGAPGGLGGAEGAMIALLGLQGIGLELSVPATAVIRLTTLWFAIAVGCGFFALAERLSPRNRHAR
ncbi:lysylphosphatidylglycerol synthase transmembrane domain-containing protein [Brevirhabdus sp.]|uniref:lysylphosphatidylglycerol synthase transmembrane domain-containing protein n=1 Tax=Brevirhabdus sp. TaxID=2004514 RepID=UPI0040583148